MTRCKIVLDNYNGKYHAGDKIIGKVECYFDQNIKIRAVKIRVKCEEHNEWNDKESYYDAQAKKHKTRWVVYTGNKDVISMEKILFNSGGHQLNRGRHVYPFTVTLPKEIPSTFHGSYGGIRWFMTAIVDVPMAIDYEDHFTFIVISPIDLNKLDDEYFHDKNYDDEKTVCCFCCQGGTVTMDVNIPKTAFVIGEEIPLKVSICNLSRENIDALQVTLKKKLKFMVKHPSSKEKDESEKIASVTEHGVGAHGEHTYNIILSVPSNQEIPNFALCTLFESKYQIKITAEAPGCSIDLEVIIHPKIGHIQKEHIHYQRSQMNTVVQPHLSPVGTPYPFPAGYTSQGSPYLPAPGPSTNGYAASGLSTNGYAASGSSDKPVYTSGSPSAPPSYSPNLKAAEANPIAPSAPPLSDELPPPSYSEIEKINLSHQQQ